MAWRDNCASPHITASLLHHARRGHAVVRITTFQDATALVTQDDAREWITICILG
jgi:hypothetical protein